MTVQGGSMVAEDDFSSGNLSKWTTVIGPGTGYHVSGGRLVNSTSMVENVMVNNLPLTLENGYFSCEIGYLEEGTGPQPGVVVLYQDVNNYCYVTAAYNVLTISQKSGGTVYTRSSTGIPAMVSGVMYPLSVNVNERKITACFNGSQTISWTAPWSKGKVGFREYTNGPPTKMGVWDNVVVTTDDPGEVASYDDYDPYGQVLAGRSGNNGLADCKYKFTGKEQDEETSLLYFGARYYDSWRGQWLSVDPMAEKYPGWSAYNYSLDNPSRFLDPHGDTVTVITLRTRVTKVATQGMVHVEATETNKKFTGWTIELPDDRRAKAGFFKAHQRYSGHSSDGQPRDYDPARIQMVGVARENGESMSAQIHAGNTVFDTEGCILVGNKRTLTGNAIKGGTSVPALREINRIIDGDGGPVITGIVDEVRALQGFGPVTIPIPQDWHEAVIP